MGKRWEGPDAKKDKWAWHGDGLTHAHTTALLLQQSCGRLRCQLKK